MEPELSDVHTTYSAPINCASSKETSSDHPSANSQDSFFPKGLLPFHKYESHVSTAFKEHLLEATMYASTNNKTNLHFTISEVHKDMFESELKDIKKDLENEINKMPRFK